MPTFDVQETFRSDVSTTMDDAGYISATASRKLTVLTSTASTPIEVKLYAAIPREGDYHPETLQLYVTSVKVAPAGNTNILFDVDVSYGSRKKKSNEDPSTPPYELPVEISWKALTTDEAVDEDRNGEPIAVPFTNELITGITRPVTDIVGVFKKNYAGFDPSSIYVYNNATNSDTFAGFAPGTGMVKNIEATLGVGADIPFWAVTVEIHFRVPYRTTDAKAWWKRVICQGFYEKDTEGNIVRAMDDEKTPVSTAVLIDKVDGTRKPEGSGADWLEFDTTNGSLAFSDMGIL